ncbi:MAG: HD domain-containing protein [Candidatus Thorarchaeota archaeon SMTZ1-45]
MRVKKEVYRLNATHRMIEEFVRERLAKSDLGAHTLDHTRRVYTLSIEIGREIGADLKILGAAALLHDIGRPEEATTSISHAILSGNMSRDILKKVGLDDAEIDKVVDAIRTHRFSEGIEPNSLEGEILSDADKLDAMGAIGVFRAIAQAASTGVGIEGFLKHADEKLLKLRDLMYTDQARIEAENRHQTLEVFVKQLRDESSRKISDLDRVQDKTHG